PDGTELRTLSRFASPRIGPTTNVTGIVAGDPWAPGAVTVTFPVYMPTGRFPVRAEISKKLGVEPEPGETLNQEESLAVLKFSVLPPAAEFVTPTEAGVGSTPLPCIALNERGAVESDSTGCGPTVKITPMVAEKLWTPPVVTVTYPV